jgi:hypothetical protein
VWRSWKKSLKRVNELARSGRGLYAIEVPRLDMTLTLSSHTMRDTGSSPVSLSAGSRYPIGPAHLVRSLDAASIADFMVRWAEGTYRLILAMFMVVGKAATTSA